MSRVSIGRRIAALLNAAERIDPRATRVYRLPPALRLKYDRWRADCEAMETDGEPDAAYRTYLDTGHSDAPPMPRDVADALGVAGAPVLTVDMSDAEVEDIWKAMVEDDLT